MGISTVFMVTEEKARRITDFPQCKVSGKFCLPVTDITNHVTASGFLLQG